MRAPSITGRVTDRPVARWTACSSAAVSAAEAGRSPGSLAISRSTTSASSPGTPFARRSGTGSRRMRATVTTISSPVSPANAGPPLSSAKSVAPSPYRSVATVASPFMRRSGALYVAVARTRPSSVTVRPGRREMPKSPSAGSAKRDMRMLAGLTSRCRIPARCAVSSAPASSTPMSRTSDHGNGPPCAIRSASEPPGHEVHDDEGLAVRRGASAVDGDDVRMARQRAHGPALALEPAPGLVVADPGGEHLHGDATPERGFVGGVHDPEAAPPDRLGSFETRDDREGSGVHGRSLGGFGAPLGVRSRAAGRRSCGSAAARPAGPLWTSRRRPGPARSGCAAA